MFRKNLLKKFILTFAILAFVGCDKDFNTIDASVIGENNYTFESYNEGIVAAYNQGLGVMQSNNLPVNPLGIYKDPNFHNTTAHFVTQLQLNNSNFNPTFGDSLRVENVELLVPYFSTRTSAASDGTSQYRLESVYGTPESKMKLSVYENGYFLRDTDPENGFTSAQRFFVDQRPDFDSNRYGSDFDGNSVLFGSRLNDSTAVSQNDAFFFDKSEIKTITVQNNDTTTTYTPPAMKLSLNKKFFEKKIFSPQGKANMVNNNTFKNYFRGLYFKIEEVAGEDGQLAQIDFLKGKVIITYSEIQPVNNVPTRIEKTIELNMTGNSVSLQETTNLNTAYSNALTSANSENGDASLYLKGGSGSMAIIELFGNGQLDSLRSLNWKINEASLTFYVDRPKLGATVVEPNRIYLYDLKNNRPLIDYFTDISTNTANPKNGKVVHGGIIEKLPSDDRGDKYKIRITNHVSNLIRKDSTNVQLGLVITDDYRIVSNMDRKNPGASDVKKAPTASVMNPLGTILVGNNNPPPNPNEKDRRLKLEIFYTKVN